MEICVLFLYYFLVFSFACRLISEFFDIVSNLEIRDGVLQPKNMQIRVNPLLYERNKQIRRY